MRAGKFALINPVSTSTEGRCVASTRWMPDARAICAKRAILSSTSLAPPSSNPPIHRSSPRYRAGAPGSRRRQERSGAAIRKRSLSGREPLLFGQKLDRQFRLVQLGRRFRLHDALCPGDLSIVGVDVPHPGLGKQLIAPLHFSHDPTEPARRRLGIGDDRTQEMERSSYVWNSSILGSIRSSLTSSGRAENSRLRSIVLRLTLFPAPVAPATSKCGMVFRSVIEGAPKMSFPKAKLSFDPARENASLVTTSFIDTVSR